MRWSGTKYILNEHEKTIWPKSNTIRNNAILHLPCKFYMGTGGRADEQTQVATVIIWLKIPRVKTLQYDMLSGSIAYELTFTFMIAKVTISAMSTC